MGKLIIVSNRLPITMKRTKGELSITQSVGGLATGLGSFYQSRESVWVGWPGIASNLLSDEQCVQIKSRLGERSCHPVFLTQRQIDNYYNGFCNRTIWPLFHYFPLYTQYKDSDWRAYFKVNTMFRDAVMEVATSEDTIWVQDYQLMLLPRLLRAELPQAKIGFFLHIPFPSSEIFRLLPWREELLHGLLGSDLIGFHTYDYVRHFLTSIRRLLGFGQAMAGRLVVSTGQRLVKVDAFPMGIDYERFSLAADSLETKREMERIRGQIGPRQIILSVDRMDYTKGLIQRLEAFDLFLSKFPKYRGKVTFVLKAIASRAGVTQYQELKSQLDELVGRVNGKYGSLEWMPVWYLFRFLPESMLIALYRLADVALLTPVRDGMNLIAKEFIATKTDQNGVLILSELAGAAQELQEALIVNPNNLVQMANAIRSGLEMPKEEQQKRLVLMQSRMRNYNVVRWAEDFIEGLESIKRMQERFAAKKLTVHVKRQLLEKYRFASKRLFLLDYDGTLVQFAGDPQEASPPEQLMELLRQLSSVEGNSVVIISGRDRPTLERWFGSLNVGLVAEHGVWYKEPQEPWQIIEPLTEDWKESIRPLFELYVSRTPGSSLEEKEYSLVWHYRKAEKTFAEVRVGELKESLEPLLENKPLAILEGHRFLEVKNAGINKGRIARQWISKKDWDFILAAGDDTTDEDMFQVLPDTACSIRIGMSPSHSRFAIESPRELRRLLRELMVRKSG
jgi:trehalose 6-phosphate synthase/phosphatase